MSKSQPKIEKVRQTINISEIRRITSLDRSTIANYLLEVQPATVKGNKNATEYFIDDVLGVLVRSFKAQSAEGPKMRKLMAEARRSEIALAQLEGTLVPIAAMRNSAVELLKTLYQRCVVLSPKFAADRLTGRSHEHGEIEIAVRELYAEIFEELRTAPNNFIPETLAAAKAETNESGTQTK